MVNGLMASDALVADIRRSCEDGSLSGRANSITIFIEEIQLILNRLAASESQLAAANERVEELKKEVRLRKMAADEDACGSVSVGGLASDLGMIQPRHTGDALLDQLNEHLNTLNYAKTFVAVSDEWRMHMDGLCKNLIRRCEDAETKLAQYESGATLSQNPEGIETARECAEKLWKQHATTSPRGREMEVTVEIILAHTSAVVEPWRDALTEVVDFLRSDTEDEPMQGEEVECPECGTYVAWPVGLPVTRCRACVLNAARALIASQGVGDE